MKNYKNTDYLERIKAIEKRLDKLEGKIEKDKITLDEFWNSDKLLAIYCDTKDQAEKLCKVFDKMGKTWKSGRCYLSDISWRDSCCYYNDRTWDDLQPTLRKCYKVYKIEDVIFPEEPKHEFKVGDRVQFKTWEELEEEFGGAEYCGGGVEEVSRIELSDGFHFTSYMKFLCGTYATISCVSKSRVWLKDFTKKEANNRLFIYTLDMIKTAMDEPKWTFTDDEKVILRNVPEDYNWIARDKDDILCCFKSRYKPNKDEFFGVWNCSNASELRPFSHLFQSIKWEDAEPCEFRKYL